MNIGIYKIENKINGKIYVGSSIHISTRFNQHKRELKKSIHGNSHLQQSFNKYGKEYFIFSVIELCEKENLITKEQYWIDFLQVTNSKFGYNKNPIAGTTAGRSPDIAAKIVATRRKNNPNWHPSDISDRIKASLANKDLSHSDETKEKISKTIVEKVIKNRKQSAYDKMAKTKRNKPIAKLYKKVKCIENNIIYDSIGHAAKSLNLHRTGISMVLSKTIVKTGGLSFERVV